MLNLVAAVLNNWRVVLFAALIGSLTLFFVVNKARLTAAQNAADGYRAELLQYRQAAEQLSAELEASEQRAKLTDKILSDREQEKVAAEKRAEKESRKYKTILRETRDACANSAMSADVLGWLRDNTN
jgi:hypothetical protein